MFGDRLLPRYRIAMLAYSDHVYDLLDGIITIDEQYCGSNVVTYSGSSRLVCPVNDFGEFCSYYGSPYLAGLVWPAGGGLRNE